MITTISLVIIYHHTKILHYYWLYSPHLHFILVIHLFCNWKFGPFNFRHLFHSSPYLLPSGNHQNLLVLCIYDSVSVLLGLFLCFLFLDSTKDKYTPMLTAALFTIAKIWKQAKCPSIDEWIKKMWYIYIYTCVCLCVCVCVCM